jgi:hypothetical protein
METSQANWESNLTVKSDCRTVINENEINKLGT